MGHNVLGWLLAACSMFFCCCAQLSSIQNPLTVLERSPNFSSFRRLLNETGVIQEIQSRSSLTLLVPQDSVLEAVFNRSNSFPLPLVADVVRYHCLLQYLDMQQIRTMTNSNGVLVTTLYQTTGRAAGQNGFLNISVADGGIHAGIPFANKFNATVVSNITQFPYNISYLEVDQVLVPPGLGSPQAAAGSILNLTRSLQQAGRFNTFLNLMQTTGLTAVLASLPAFTVFAPSDDAFRQLPRETLDTLSSIQATQLLNYHVLPSYASLGTLQTTESSVVQTVASNGNNQNFLLQVTGINNGGVTLSTGTNVAQVVSSVMDEPPVAAYAINRVLLPSEIFRTSATSDLAPSGAPSLAPAAAATLPPSAPAADVPAASSAAPPPLEQQAASPAAAEAAGGPGESNRNTSSTDQSSGTRNAVPVLASLWLLVAFLP